MTSAKFVSFIVPTFNSAATLHLALASIRKQNYDPNLMELLVLDNGSTDKTLDIAREFKAQVEVLPKVSISRLRNYGAQLAKGEVLIFLDSDCEIDSGWTWRALELLQPSKVAAVGSPMLYSMRSNYIGEAINAQAPIMPEATSILWVPSAALAVKKTIFEGLGGFDECLLTCEDVDFGYRLYRQSYLTVAEMSLSPRHHGDPADFMGLMRKEYWRGTDSLVLLYKYPQRMRELLSNAYQLWFYLLLLACLIALVSGKMLLTLVALVLFFLPILVFSLRTALKRGDFSNFKSLVIFYSAYYFARSLVLPRSLARVWAYRQAKR